MLNTDLPVADVNFVQILRVITQAKRVLQDSNHIVTQYAMQLEVI